MKDASAERILLECIVGMLSVVTLLATPYLPSHSLFLLAHAAPHSSVLSRPPHCVPVDL